MKPGSPLSSRRLRARSRARRCSLSQGALQGVVVVFEAFELQEVFGSLAPLARGGKVGHLDGGGGAPRRGARQVFGCRLVMLIQTGAAGIGLHPGWTHKKTDWVQKQGENLPVDISHNIHGYTYTSASSFRACW